MTLFFFFFSSRRRHTRWTGDWSSDVCSSDLSLKAPLFLCRRLPPVCRGEVVGHGPDFVLGPEGAAPDHAVEHALPASAVLTVVLPHRRGVALKAFADQHFLSRRVGEPGRLGALRLRRRREEQAADENRKRGFTGKGHGDCLLWLPATISRASRECQSRPACPARLRPPAAASGASWIPSQSARGALGA